ncbi:MAG: hypothetical protein ACRDWE_07025, partial [Acidimicrobiales bacterium]
FSPLVAGAAFLPMPASVFLGSQLTSRVLVRRFPLRAVTLAGITLSAIGLLLATQLQATTGYVQIAGWFVLVGSGTGIAFVTLTTASLHEVQPADAGAASGLVNVSQQLGAALGLAVLVTLFDLATGGVQLGASHPASRAAAIRVQSVVTGGMHDVFDVAVLLTLSALVLVAVGFRRAAMATPVLAPAPRSDDEGEGDVEELVDSELDLLDAG